MRLSGDGCKISSTSASRWSRLSATIRTRATSPGAMAGTSTTPSPVRATPKMPYAKDSIVTTSSDIPASMAKARDRGERPASIPAAGNASSTDIGGSAMHADLRCFERRADFTRRQFVVTSLAAGFALAVRPVRGDTIVTDAQGLEAGEVKIPVAGWRDPRLPGDARPQAAKLRRSSSSSRRSSGSTSTSRTSAAVSPSWATWPSRRSSTRGKATFRRSTTSRRSSSKVVPRCRTPR